ncbi:MAG TPA: hypothetical protein VMX94_03660 [Armatimonadota bacterium]|nr:hypothetical protein [Armatimonadota bacterium]
METTGQLISDQTSVLGYPRHADALLEALAAEQEQPTVGQDIIGGLEELVDGERRWGPTE